MSDSPTRALALPVPTSPVRFRLARSLKAASVGEVMALDERGDVVDPRRSRLANARLWFGAATMGALGWGSVAALGGAAFLGPVFLVGCNKSPEGGAPGTSDTFKVVGPTMTTDIKQDNKESVKISESSSGPVRWPPLEAKVRTSTS